MKIITPLAKAVLAENAIDVAIGAVFAILLPISLLFAYSAKAEWPAWLTALLGLLGIVVSLLITAVTAVAIRNVRRQEYEEDLLDD